MIADVVDGQLVEVDRRMTIVRLGQGVDSTGAFAPEALARVFAAAEQFAAVIEAKDISRLRFVATSAARDVSNRDEFFTGIQERLGVTPRSSPARKRPSSASAAPPRPWTYRRRTSSPTSAAAPPN
ncbi:hypothetical protein AB0E69_40710 [Kribbella sp. NPDC026611]|uniref:Ppx/GppA phosphatase family protein n=1 Tax=Kribbella sp. NPDC026611 TaxID=3154911 RepID=UPI0033E32814